MEPIVFRDPRQERIHRLLHDLVGPGVAAFFRDACRMMAATDRLECTSHFVGHAMREIESAIRDVLLPAPEAKQKRRGGSNHRTEIVGALDELGIPEDHPVRESWLRLSEPDQGLARRAHRDSLRPTRGLDQGFEAFWDSMLQIFDTVVRAFETRYCVVYERIARLASQASPSPSDGDWMANHVPHNHYVLNYLFKKLSDPAWLPVMREAHLFDHPPSADYDEESGTWRLRPWPASQHLARMVARAPDVVADIADGIETDNPTVLADLIEVACQLPAAKAAKLVPKCLGWHNLPHWHVLPESISRLVVHLGQGGEANPAFELARSLLAFDSLARPEQEIDDRLPAEPHSRMTHHEYEHALASSLGYVGRVLCPSGDRFAADQLDRVKALFEWRLRVVAGSVDSPSEAAELADFGYWLGSDRLDDTWSLATLAKVAKVCRTAHPPHMVLERLADLAQEHPRACVECLDALLDGLPRLWLFWDPGNDVCRIITQAQASPDSSAWDTASKVVNRLAARGVPEYRLLLKHRCAAPTAFPPIRRDV